MNNITKFIKFISLFIALVGAYFFIKILTIDGDDVSALSRPVSLFINFTKIVLYITIAIVLIFTVKNLLKNPKAMKKALISLGALAVVFALSYMMADGGKVVTSAGTLEAGSTSKLVSAGMWFSILLGAVAFIGFIFDTVKTLVK
ncbi:MAG: hypothetical protein L3J23_09155 [Flavobacteriaceae bacterium]|nr:hypothetical protein [Flavobacteriaceae bacterium]